MLKDWRIASMSPFGNRRAFSADDVRGNDSASTSQANTVKAPERRLRRLERDAMFSEAAMLPQCSQFLPLCYRSPQAGGLEIW